MKALATPLLAALAKKAKKIISRITYLDKGFNILFIGINTSMCLPVSEKLRK